MLNALDHVVLAVRDLDLARDEYCRLLGREPSWIGTHPGGGTANVLFRLDNMYLELLARRGDGATGRHIEAWIERHGEGLVGLAFATDDLEAVRASLTSRGVACRDGGDGHGRDERSGAERRWQRIDLAPKHTRGVTVFAIRHDSPPGTLPLARATGSESAAAHALDHVVLQTADGDAARRLYGDALGVRLALDRQFPDWGVRLMFFRVGGVTVEVASLLPGADRAKALPGAAATATEDRLYGLSYRVRDIDAAHARLAAAGVDVSEVRAGRRPDTRVFTVRSGTRGVPTLFLELAAGQR